MIPGDLYDENGNYVGTDNKDDNKIFIVQDKRVARGIKRSGGTVEDASQVESAVEIPRNDVLKESLDVLNRTEDNGGLSEESSLVMKDGLVVRGETGEPGEIVSEGGFNFLQASTSIPTLPGGSSDSDVEAMIHSHLTEVLVKDGQVFGQDAEQPSVGRADQIAFNRFDNNVIVGRLGISRGTKGSDGKITLNKAPLGAAFFRGTNLKPKISIRKRAIEKIVSHQSSR